MLRMIDNNYICLNFKTYLGPKYTSYLTTLSNYDTFKN